MKDDDTSHTKFGTTTRLKTAAKAPFSRPIVSGRAF